MTDSQNMKKTLYKEIVNSDIFQKVFELQQLDLSDPHSKEDVLKEIDNAVKGFLNQMDKIKGNKLYYYLFSLHRNEIPKFIVSSKEDTMNQKSRKYVSLKNSDEIELRNLFIDFNQTINYPLTLKDFISDLKDELKYDIDQVYKTHLDFLINFYENIFPIIGNPINLKQTISNSRILITPTEFFYKNYIYQRQLSEYLHLIGIDGDSTSFETYYFRPLDAFLNLLSLVSDEIIKSINQFLDMYYPFLIENNLFSDFIQDIENLIYEYQIKIIDELEFSNVEQEDDFFSFFEHYLYRLNRDKIYKKHDFLTKLTNPEKLTNSEVVKLETINNRIKYYCEDSLHSESTFRRNIKKMKEFMDTYNLFSSYHEHQSIPCISVRLDKDDELTNKIIYHEFYVLQKEHKILKDLKESVTDYLVPQILQNIIDSINESTKEDFVEDKGSNLYNNSENFDKSINEKNIILYEQSILLTEKIRRGFYREFGFMDEYKKIFELNCKLRDFFTYIFSGSNILSMAYHIDTISRIVEEFIHHYIDWIED